MNFLNVIMGNKDLLTGSGTGKVVEGYVTFYLVPSTRSVCNFYQSIDTYVPR